MIPSVCRARSSVIHLWTRLLRDDRLISTRPAPKSGPGGPLQHIRNSTIYDVTSARSQCRCKIRWKIVRGESEKIAKSTPPRFMEELSRNFANLRFAGILGNSRAKKKQSTRTSLDLGKMVRRRTLRASSGSPALSPAVRWHSLDLSCFRKICNCG